MSFFDDDFTQRSMSRFRLEHRLGMITRSPRSQAIVPTVVHASPITDEELKQLFVEVGTAAGIYPMTSANDDGYGMGC